MDRPAQNMLMAAWGLVTLVFIGVYFVQPNDLRLRVVSSILAGCGTAISIPLTWSVAGIPRNRSWKPASILLYMVTLATVNITAQSYWYIVYRELMRPDWMRNMNIIWAYFSCIAGTGIFAALYTSDLSTIKAPPKRWLLMFGVMGMVASTILVVASFLRESMVTHVPG